MGCGVDGGHDEDRLAGNGETHALQPNPEGDREIAVGGDEIIQSREKRLTLLLSFIAFPPSTAGGGTPALPDGHPVLIAAS